MGLKNHSTPNKPVQNFMQCGIMNQTVQHSSKLERQGGANLFAPDCISSLG